MCSLVSAGSKGKQERARAYKAQGAPRNILDARYELSSQLRDSAASTSVLLPPARQLNFSTFCVRPLRLLSPSAHSKPRSTAGRGHAKSELKQQQQQIIAHGRPSFCLLSLLNATMSSCPPWPEFSMFGIRKSGQPPISLGVSLTLFTRKEKFH